MFIRSYFKYEFIAITLIVMLCSCSENEYSDYNNEPISFNATINSRTQTRTVVDTSKSGSNLIVYSAEVAKGIAENVSKMTRATVDGNWSSGNIAVDEGNAVKEYNVDTSGNITSSSPFYWLSKDNISITSWYPYSLTMPTVWTVNIDQSTEDKYEAKDFLYASGTLTYGKSSSLTYNHKTAKVVVNIVKANDVTSASNISSVTIGTSGTPIDLSGTVGTDGTITGTTTTTGFITPYQTTSSTYAATYSALVIPQDMNGKQFIAIKVVGGNTFYYKPSTSTSLSGGYVYTYNITVPSSTANIGDYYFSDGSWGTLAVHCTSAVWPIGIIFSNSPSAIDQGYGWKHGYAISLARSASTYWSTYTSTDEAGNVFGSYTYADYAVDYGSFITNKEGYSETHAIGNKATYSQSTYPAFWYALNYGTSLDSGTTLYSAPVKSSGWFIPSVGQWWDIITNLGGLSTTPTRHSIGACDWYTGSSGTCLSTFMTNINKYFTKVVAYNSEININSFGNSDWYATSSEYSNNIMYRANFDISPNVSLDNWVTKSDVESDGDLLLRCCIAF